MLPAANRLTHQGDFRRVVRSGCRAGSATVVVHLLLPDDEQTTPSTGGGVVAGFVVSRAVGNSVIRHRVQRQLRHLVQDRLSGLPERSELVVRALPAATGASYARLGADLDLCLNRCLDRVS
jgi:ribonuclease P protein component